MRWVALGQDAVGVIAIGQQATGVIAVGQLATGVIAVGQLARGVIVVGQVAIGAAVFGQLVAGLAWAGGMLGIGALRGPGLAVGGLYGSLPWSELRRGRVGTVAWSPNASRCWWRALVLAALILIVARLAVLPLLHELTRTGGVFGSPPVLR